MIPAGNARAFSDRSVRLLTLCALGLAMAGLAVWLWTLYCRFPAITWNDVRLAPSIALAQGHSVYPTGQTGTVNTWTYGPLPLLFFWPASWAASPDGAMLIAGAFNLGISLGALAFVCFGWPNADPHLRSILPRVVAFAFCAVAWPEWHYLFHLSDNLAIACALVSSTLLVRRSQHASFLWLSAAIGVAAINCKQIAVSVAAAQIMWLLCTHGVRAAMNHTLRYGALGAVAAAAMCAAFGYRELWFTLVALPGRFGWTPDPMARLRDVGPHLALHLSLPAIALILFHRRLLRGDLLLGSLLWLVTLPLGVIALFKTGGRMNSVYSFVLWLPIITTALLTRRPHFGVPLGTVATTLLVCCRLLWAIELPLQPQLHAYRDALRFAPLMRERVWFPLHPLITLYTERRYYHDEDGLYVRYLAKLPLTHQQLWSHLPPKMGTIAFPENLTTWGVARQLLPADAQKTQSGCWELWHPSPPKTP